MFALTSVYLGVFSHRMLHVRVAFRASTLSLVGGGRLVGTQCFITQCHVSTSTEAPFLKSSDYDFLPYRGIFRQVAFPELLPKFLSHITFSPKIEEGEEGTGGDNQIKASPVIPRDVLFFLLTGSSARPASSWRQRA